MKKLFLMITVAALAVTACKKSTPTPVLISSNVTAQPTNTTVDVNSTPQTSFTLDGVSHSYVVDNTHFFSGSSTSGNGSNNKSFDADIDDGDSIVYINITKGTLHTYSTDSVFKAYFPVGSFPYSVNALNGIEISVWDNHVRWSTSMGSGNQTGSTFNIVQTKDDQQGYLYIDTYITFSCKVYNSAGAMKTITNGKFVGSFGNF